MEIRLFLALILIAAILIVGCSKSPSGYANYNQYPQGQQQQPYVGGGCGVAPSNIAESVVDETVSASTYTM